MKCNPCTVIKNLRPTAITSIFSKIQESYALEWMLEDAKDNIGRRQFGGVSESSPVLTLFEMPHNSYSAMENHDTVNRVIFLDFTKTFDLIDHNFLFSDFQMICVRPALISWLASYLFKRQQGVKFDGELSSLLTINAGVPQGSKKGFFTKINHVPDVAVTDSSTNTGSVSTFIDDTRMIQCCQS